MLPASDTAGEFVEAVAVIGLRVLSLSGRWRRGGIVGAVFYCFMAWQLSCPCMQAGFPLLLKLLLYLSRYCPTG